MMKKLITLIILAFSVSLFHFDYTYALEIPVEVNIVGEYAPESTKNDTPSVPDTSGTIKPEETSSSSHSGTVIMIVFIILATIAFSIFIKRYLKDTKTLKLRKMKKSSILPLFLTFLFVTVATAAAFIPVLNKKSHAEESDELDFKIINGELKFDIKKGETGVFEKTVKIDLTKKYSKYNYFISTSLPRVNKTFKMTINDLDEYAGIEERNHSGDVELVVKVTIDDTLPVGKYEKKILVTPEAVPTIFDISKMQEITPAICANTTTPLNTATELVWEYVDDNTKVPRTVLTDMRDGNKDLVSKLADGNCWMSQNLALVLSTETPLTSELTDLNTKTSWTPGNNTQTENRIVWWQDENITRSYKPVDMNSYFINGATASGAPTSSDDEYLWESVGVYYNWFAATAGSGTRELDDKETAGDSICPKGWRLPVDNDDEQTYKNLSTIYGNNGTESYVSAPFNYVKSGYYDDDSGYLYSLEFVGHYWSASSTGQIYTSSIRLPDYYDSYLKYYGEKTRGYTMRCLAR